MQILSVFGSELIADRLHPLLYLPVPYKIAFACRLGYLMNAPFPYLRVRREAAQFVHRNRFAR